MKLNIMRTEDNDYLDKNLKVFNIVQKNCEASLTLNMKTEEDDYLDISSRSCYLESLIK